MYHLKLENITADKDTLLKFNEPEHEICIMWTRAAKIWYVVIETDEVLLKFLKNASRFCVLTRVTGTEILEVLLFNEKSFFIKSGKISLLERLVE
jgi:hypothetical protein